MDGSPQWGLTQVTVKHGSSIALDQIDLTVVPGQIVALVGGDGAGKTTALRTLIGAISPTTGTVRRPARRDIGFMPSTSGVWSELTVAQNIAFAADVYGVRGADLTARKEQILQVTALGPARDRLAAQLSGGMRQKLAFALATMHRPQMLVLDEPTTGVDPVSRVELWRMVSQAAVAGTAVVIATTYLDEAERAGHVLVLAAGRVLLSGSPTQVVQAVPGTVIELLAAQTEPEDPAVVDLVPAWRRWRRGQAHRAWLPADAPLPPAAVVVVPDMEDAVIAAALAQEATHVTSS